MIKKCFITVFLLSRVAFGQLGFEKEKVLCPLCQDSGMVSNVYPGYVTTTLMYCGEGYYDTLGVYHPAEPCNSSCKNYTCSKGHVFSLPETNKRW